MIWVIWILLRFEVRIKKIIYVDLYGCRFFFGFMSGFCFRSIIFLNLGYMYVVDTFGVICLFIILVEI